MIAVALAVFARFFSLMALLLSNVAFAASWSANVDSQGMLEISKGGATAISSKFAFWEKNWAWANQPVDFNVVAPFEYTVAGKNKPLNFDLVGRVSRSSTKQLSWDFGLNARSTLTDVIGGGVVYQFNLESFKEEMGEPVLLPDNRGWVWGRAAGNRVEMRFDPPLAKVYFERGSKSEIRAFFYNGEVPQGLRRHVATLSIVGDITIVPSTIERFGSEDRTTWLEDILDWKTSPVDLSFLNASEKPAGKRGFLTAHGDSLRFEDGTMARFWGTNLNAYALYTTSKENVKLQARRLSELGFNLVRLHHHDSIWVNPNIFGDETVRDTQHISSAMLEKIDWWIKCLKDEGIYIWMDLHVGRQFQAGDGIDGFEEIGKGKPPRANPFGYNYVNVSIQRAMKRFNEEYVNHVNGYTGLRYKDEPAIATMLITNENDVTHHFGNALLGDKGVPKHNALYMGLAEAFATKYGLPKEKVWRSWEHGPPKIFLNDLEYRFNSEMIQHLRSRGVKVPLVTTSTWGNPLSSLPALTEGNVIDVHAYGGVRELEKNPTYAANLMHWIAAARVVGKPLSVTEWGVEDNGWFAPDRGIIPLYVASYASLQGWNSVMLFAYSQVPFGKHTRPSIYEAYNDPGMMASLPAAALLYRRGQVREATTTYVFLPGKEMMFNREISAKNSVALRTAAEKGKLMIAMPQSKELPWLTQSTVPAGVNVITDPKQSLLAVDAAEAVSDTGELRRNWEQGTFTINTPMSQASMGWIGGKKFSLADVDIATTTRNATIAVQSLDGKPISNSGRILISIGARASPKSPNSLPFLSEPVEGQITIRAPAGLKLYIQGRLVEDGLPEKATKPKPAEKRLEISMPYKDGRYQIRLSRSLGTSWLVLR